MRPDIPLLLPSKFLGWSNKQKYPRLGSATTIFSLFTITRTRLMRRSIVIGECLHKRSRATAYLRSNFNGTVLAFALDNSCSFVPILAYKLRPTTMGQKTHFQTLSSYLQEMGSMQMQQQRKSQIAKIVSRISFYFEGNVQWFVDNQSFRMACSTCDSCFVSI